MSRVYSAEHYAAVERLKAAGWDGTKISEQDVAVIQNEDERMGLMCRDQRAKAAAKAIAALQTKAAPAPTRPSFLSPENLADILVEFGKKLIAPTMERVLALEEKNARLEAKCAELDARPLGLMYRGVYQKAATYYRDECVTHGGSAWACLKDDVRCDPGTDTSAWQLMVKRGADGKDAQ